MDRSYIEALLIGLCIGFTALLLNWWVGDASWRPRVMALLAVGWLICMLQYGLARIRGGR
ncbi:MAG: hypothetical protein WCG26_07180 [Chloroflexales bacterium]